MDTIEELRLIFIDVVTREYDRIESEDAEDKERLRRKVEEGIMKLADSHQRGLSFTHEDYEEELQIELMLATADKSSSRLHHLLLMHYRFSEAIMKLFALRRLQSRLRHYQLKEWLELPDDLCEWEQIATRRYFEILEGELVQGMKDLIPQEASDMLQLSCFFRVPLSSRLEGFVKFTCEPKTTCTVH
jgi:hypothetical protein